MAHLTNNEINNAMKDFNKSSGGDEWVQYFPRRNRLKKFLGWKYYLIYRMIRRKVKRLWMNLPSL